MSREHAQHRPHKSNYGWRDALGECPRGAKQHYKRVVRRGRRASERRLIERAHADMDTSTVEFKG